MSGTAGKRIGKFYIPAEMVEDNYELVQQVMALCVPIHAEHFYAKGKFAYTATSDRFDAIGEGEVIPEYDIRVDVTGGIRFKRVE